MPSTLRASRGTIRVILLFVVSTFLAGLYSLRLGTAMTTLLPGGPNILPESAYTQTKLLEDHFTRLDQTYWGAVSTGLAWGGNASNNPAFTIRDGHGMINGKGFFVGTIPVATNDMEIIVTASLDDFSQNWFGAILRVSNQTYWYEARVKSDQITIMRRSGDTENTIATASISSLSNHQFTLRFRSVEDQLTAKVWATGTNEPDDWQVAAFDSDLKIGYSGLVVNLLNSSALTVYEVTLLQLDKKQTSGKVPGGGLLS